MRFVGTFVGHLNEFLVPVAVLVCFFGCLLDVWASFIFWCLNVKKVMKGKEGKEEGKRRKRRGGREKSGSGAEPRRNF